MIMRAYLLLLAFCSLCVLRSTAQECVASNNQPGTCKVIHQCPELNSIFSKKVRSRADNYYLSNYMCNYFDSRGRPYVCCANDGGITQEFTTTPAQNRNSNQGPNIPSSDLSSNQLPSEIECGYISSGKIYGGEITELDEFPWAALLAYKKNGQRNAEEKFKCGGSLINKRYILTAAHCTHVTDFTLVGVRLGEHTVSSNTDCVDKGIYGKDCTSDQTVDVGIQKKIVHPDYRSASLGNDIALLKLDRDVTYTHFIKPVCLPTTVKQLSQTYVSENLTVTGWGRTEFENKSDVKLKVSVPVKENSVCNTRYRSAGLNMKSSQLCAGGDIGKDSCTGDSGGPLMTIDPDSPHMYVVGLVSIGWKPCGIKDTPAIYTKVAPFMEWIIKEIEKK